MARCDQGYLCDVCDEEVEHIWQSDLYLRFVTGQISSQDLLSSPERHLLCNPVVAQFIVNDEFPEIHVEGPFGKTELDPEQVRQQEDLMSRGWLRLMELQKIAKTLPVHMYPLPEVIAKNSKTEK